MSEPTSTTPLDIVEPQAPVLVVSSPVGEVIMPINENVDSAPPSRSSSPVITGPSGSRRAGVAPVDSLAAPVRKNAYRSASRRRAQALAPSPVFPSYSGPALGSGSASTLPHVDARGQMGLYQPQNSSHSSARRDDPPVFRHARPVTFMGRLKHQTRLAWESFKTAYWHIEPWVVRPLVAGFVYNFGTQIARILLQNFLPSYFPKTVYLPLKADAQFYNLYNHTAGAHHDIPLLQEPPIVAITTDSTNI